MKIKFIKYLVLILVFATFVSGCNPIYRLKIENAYSKLEVGMSEEVLDKFFGKFELLKEQKIVIYPNSTHEMMKRMLANHRNYDDLYPKNIFENIPFDGSIKVFSYFFKKTPKIPEGWVIHRIAIFYDEANNKVIGWAKIHTMIKVKDWTDKF